MTALAYRGVLSAPFVYEDRQSLAMLGQGHYWPWEILGYVTRSPWVFHLENLLFHLTNGVLLALVCKSVWGWRVALVSATVFLLHPLQTESVAYVSGQTELVSVCGLLLALLIGVTTRRHVWPASVLMALCLAMAVMAKSAAIVVLGLAPFALYVLHRRVTIGPLLACLGVLALLRLDRITSLLTNPSAFQNDLTGWAYLSQQAVAVWTLLSLCLIPVGLTVDHDFGLAPWSACLIALIGIGIALLTACMALRKAPVYAAVVGWLALALWPRFVLRPSEWITEHHLALSLVGISIAVGYACDSFMEVPVYA